MRCAFGAPQFSLAPSASWNPGVEFSRVVEWFRNTRFTGGISEKYIPSTILALSFFVSFGKESCGFFWGHSSLVLRSGFTSVSSASSSSFRVPKDYLDREAIVTCPFFQLLWPKKKPLWDIAATFILCILKKCWFWFSKLTQVVNGVFDRRGTLVSFRFVLFRFVCRESIFVFIWC